MLRYEGNLIRQALKYLTASVTRAARLLGVTHQGLAFILNGRHSDLLSIRTPVKRRRQRASFAFTENRKNTENSAPFEQSSAILYLL